ncbi:CLUMA_CG014562, isoform A [Clunio marinus]|uniref:CLUMA_CG014562, isoform A n=1 Tax=Clunio marinus TaxID=568069 RepID=A0A1J1IPY5_9DIPT|nr:CLUMA_CG014562, isoform A [Clunio marinus]
MIRNELTFCLLKEDEKKKINGLFLRSQNVIVRAFLKRFKIIYLKGFMALMSDRVTFSLIRLDIESTPNEFRLQVLIIRLSFVKTNRIEGHFSEYQNRQKEKLKDDFHQKFPH